MKPIIDPAVEAYCETHSSAAGPLLDRLAQETRRDFTFAQMMVGDLEGAFLAFVARAIGARRILEVGTFTGTSALHFAGALPPDGELVCVDRDPLAAAVARRYLEEAGHGARARVEVGPAIEVLARLQGPFDLAFLDADKANYGRYLDAVLERLSPRGVVLVDNVLWSGAVLAPDDDDARAIAAFNDRVHADPSLEHVMVPIRDGVLMIRKRS